MMKKFEIIYETAEIDMKTENIIDAFMENGVQNGYYKIKGEYPTREEALTALKKYRCSTSISGGIRTAYMYYVQESFLNEYDEWEVADGLEFAEME